MIGFYFLLEEHFLKGLLEAPVFPVCIPVLGVFNISIT
jgi:hypothetical protein